MIPGVTIVKDKNYLIVTVSDLTAELKNEIRKRFSVICHGENLGQKNVANYTYRKTVKEFLKRVKSKSKNIQTGMLGELIIHVITGLTHPEYKTIVPYFNLEERSIKKGFDLVIYSPSLGIYVHEVKASRDDSSNVDVDKKVTQLIKTAHDDICSKLSQPDEIARLWSNAMNGLQTALGHLNDEKKILEELILEKQERTGEGTENNNGHNIILSSVLMSNSTTEIKSNCVISKHVEYNDKYRSLFIIAVHKSLLVDLINFFETEDADEIS